MGARLFTLVVVVFVLAMMAIVMFVADNSPVVAMALQLIGAAVLGVGLVSIIRWVAEG